MINTGKIIKTGLKRILFLYLVFWAINSGSVRAINQVKSLQVSDNPSKVSLVENKAESVTIQFDIGTVDFIPIFSSEGKFVLPTISGFSRSFEIGEPSLPIANKIISIPFDCQLQIDIISSEYEDYNLDDLNLTAPIMPVQPSLSKSEDLSDIKFEINQSLYRTNRSYQLPLISSEILGTLRSLRLALISFAPFKYNPIENNISICKNLTVRINFLNSNWSKTELMHKTYYSPFFESNFTGIINYESAVAATRSDITGYPIKYLIISDRMFESQLQPFIEWKTKKGFNVVVAYTDIIGYSSADIKNYISTLYNAGTPEDPAPSFVLLVGDDQQIPAFSGDFGLFVTDLPFCEFTGDYLPEIYYGRFSAQNAAELQPQIDKTLEYEQYLMPDPGYLAEVTLVSGYDASSSPTYGNGQINYGTENYFNIAHNINPNVWLHPASGASGAEEDIIGTLNDGVGFYNYTAHCNHLKHSNPEFSTTDVAELTNIHKYFLGIGNCCQPNTFGSNFETPCLGEAFLQAENKGGIGYIGASEDTYWDEDYWWAVGYGPVDGGGPDFEDTGPGAFDGVFHDHGEPVSQHYNTNGAIIMAGNLAVTESGSDWAEYYWEVYHLMGDPSVMTYFGVPTINNISFPSSIDKYGSSVVVTAAPGSYVGITADGVLHGSGYIDYTGTITIPLTPFSATGLADIVITAQNKIPYFGTMNILENSDPHVIYESSNTDDALLGNGNGLIDAGEPVNLDVELKNVGIADAADVVATLVTEDSYITITDNVENFGVISGSYGVKEIADAFAFSFGSETPDEYNATLTLSVTGSGGSRSASDPPWTSEFVLTAHKPSIGVQMVTIDDSAENGNGIVEPGETVEMIIRLDNVGSGLAGNVTGILSESDSYLIINDPDGSFGNVMPGGDAANETDRFEITVDPACPSGYVADFNLNISGDFGYAVSLTFDQTIGGREVIFSDDFSTDKGWSGLGGTIGTAEWTIGPATGGNGSDSYGNPDPGFDNSDTEDNCILGNDLKSGTSGDYSPNLTQTEWAVSPVIDCSNYTGIQFSFYRYLGIEGKNNDFAYLDLYNGLEWVRIFEAITTIDESSWNQQFYDISTYADGNPNFQIRFGLGATNVYANYCGWNIDDIRITGYNQSGLCGDVNHDGQINILDVVFIINYKYKDGPAPDPLEIADINGIEPIDILDVIYLLNYKYKSGPAPNCP